MDGLRFLEEEDARICHLVSESVFKVPKGELFAHMSDLPVVANYKTVGYANLSLSGDTVKVSMFIDYSTPERLQVEVGDKLYASLDLVTFQKGPDAKPVVFASKVYLIPSQPVPESVPLKIASL